MFWQGMDAIHYWFGRLVSRLFDVTLTGMTYPVSFGALVVCFIVINMIVGLFWKGAKG